MKNRNPYAAAHSMRAGAGAGAHGDRRARATRALEEALVDPYGPEWMDACDTRAGARVVDIDVHICRPLSREVLLERGWCCGNGCTMCPYEPRHLRGSTSLASRAEDTGIDASEATVKESKENDPTQE